MNKKAFLPLLLIPLLLACGTTGGSHNPEDDIPLEEISLAEAKVQLDAMWKQLGQEKQTKEYTIKYNLNKEYTDGIRHKYQTLVLKVDLEDYKAYLRDENDDNNGNNLYQGTGDFWYWLEPDEYWDYHIAMVSNGNCDKKIHDVITGTQAHNYELFAYKTFLEVPEGTYKNPKVYSRSITKLLSNIIANKEEDPNYMKEAIFTAYKKGDNGLVIKNVNSYDDSEHENFEYTETYEFKDGYLYKENYHSVNEIYASESEVKYNMDPLEIVIPDYIFEV